MFWFNNILVHQGILAPSTLQQMFQEDQKNLQRLFFQELKLHGEHALDSLDELEQKYSHKKTQISDIQGILSSYKSILTNICLELKKQDMKVIAKAVFKIFQSTASIVNDFMCGKLLPSAEVMIRNDCWDVDELINTKIDKICENALQNFDEVDNTSNKAEGELVELMEAMNRQLSSLNVVNYEEVHYVNFEEMILEELEYMHRRGEEYRARVESGKTKLRDLIMKIIKADDYFRKHFVGRGPASTKEMGIQTLEPLSGLPEEMKSDKCRALAKSELRRFGDEEWQGFQAKVDELEVAVFEKDLQISHLRSEVEVTKETVKAMGKRLPQKPIEKPRESTNYVRCLQMERHVIELTLTPIASEKMLAVEPIKSKPKTSKKLGKKLYTQENFFQSKKSQAESIIKSAFSIKKKRGFSSAASKLPLQKSSVFANRPHDSRGVVELLQVLESNPSEERILTVLSVESTASPNLVMSNESDMAPIVEEYPPKQEAPKEKVSKTSSNSQTESILTPERPRTSLRITKSPHRVEYHPKNNIKAASIQFKIQEEESHAPSPILIISNPKEEPWVGENKKSKHKLGEEPSLLSIIPVFTEEDLDVFGGKANAQRFELIKPKDVSRFVADSFVISSKSSPSTSLQQTAVNQQLIIQFYRFLRVTNREDPKRHSSIVRFFRFPYSFTMFPNHQTWQTSQQQSELSFKEVKPIMVRIVDLHKGCPKAGKSQIICVHLLRLFLKIGFRAAE